MSTATVTAPAPTSITFQDELEARIASGLPDAFEENLTPSDARLLLERNTSNRRPRTSVSNQYAADMAAGRWRYAAEPLKFDTNGVLQDGQHRLMSLASLEDTHPDAIIRFLIVTGLDEKAQEVMDQGARRTAGDNLGMKGIKNGLVVAAAARLMILWTEDRIFMTNAGAGKVSNIEAQTWVLDHPAFAEDVNHILRHKSSIDIPGRIFTTAYARFKQSNTQAAEEFFQMLATGANLYEGHPILTLRERASRIRREKTATSDRDYLAFLILAWNAYRSGNMIFKFQRPRGGAWTRGNFPMPL